MTTDAPLLDRTTTPPDPAPVMQLATGFMAAKHLFAASTLGLFDALAAGPATLDGLADRTGLPRRAARISADAMVALGLLERDGDTYRNGPVAAHYLAGDGPVDLRPLLRMWDQVSYPAWAGLAEALARGPAHEVYALDDEVQAVMSAGVEAHNAGVARRLSETVDFDGCRRLLDVGGGSGGWTLAVAGRWPHLEATVFEIPPVAELARARVVEAGLGSRVAVTAGDALTDPLPPGHDVFLVANCAHLWSPDENRRLLHQVRRAAAPAARLLLVDFWTDATHTEPLAAALMAGEFAVHTRNGDVYSVDEARDWLSATRWRFIYHLPLAGPQSLVLAEAT